MKFRVHTVEHLVEHETPKVAHRTPKKSFTAVAHGIIEKIWRDGPTPGVPLWGHNGRRGTPPNLTIKTQTSSSSLGSTVSNKSENSLLSCHVYLINMR